MIRAGEMDDAGSSGGNNPDELMNEDDGDVDEEGDEDEEGEIEEDVEGGNEEAEKEGEGDDSGSVDSAYSRVLVEGILVKCELRKSINECD